MFIETIYCGATGMSAITYAHNYLDRLLMFEVHVWNYENQGASIKVNSKRGPESQDFNWNPEVEIEEQTWYKSGCIKEQETEGSGHPCVHIYYNQALPDTLELPANTPSKSFFYFMTMDVNKHYSYNEFISAKNLLSQDGIGEILASNHTKNWADIWDNGLILLEGQDVDYELQEAIIASFYYLYSSLPSRSSASKDEVYYGLSPGGIANGKAYQGHVFWDMVIKVKAF